MNIFSVITLFGGLAFFLYGMRVMSDGLEKSSNGKLNKHLSQVTKNKFVAMLFGAGMTIAVQSSSAVTVMLVGLVNSGILKFGQTIGVLMGSNIGTTLTAWILSLAGIESDVVWINLLKPANFAPLFAFIGIVLVMVGKKQKSQSTGSILIGFAILMFGMTLMSDAMEPLSEMPEFASVLTAFKNPILAVLVGAVFTGVIQSSAASVAILQALSISGGITYGMALPIIMGQNIGTCVTAVLSSIGVNKNAKKVAVVHLSFNIIGTIIGLVVFGVGNMIFRWAFVNTDITPFMIAVCHSIFNVATTLILLPFTQQLEWIANHVIREEEDEEEKEVLLDERILSVPTMAVNRAYKLAIKMGHLAEEAFNIAVRQIEGVNEKDVAKLEEMELELDRYQDQLSTYMMRLSTIGLGDDDAKKVTKILHSIDDFERIGDYGVALVKIVKEVKDGGQAFSDEAHKEIAKMTEAVKEIMSITVHAFETGDLEEAAVVEPLEEAIHTLILGVKRRHIKRLKDGICTKQKGFAFNDALTNYERVADHCSNIAVAIIEAEHGSFDTHEYLYSIKGKPNELYQTKYKEYLEKYYVN